MCDDRLNDKITLQNMRFFGYHGVLPEEQAEGQPFEVDVELFLPLREAAASDALEVTLDYRLAYGLVRDIVEGRRYDLLEALAGAIAEALRARFGLNLVVVRVRKPRVQLGGPLDFAEVQVVRGGAPR